MVYLVDGSIGGVVVIEFHNDGGCAAVLSRHEHEVGKALGLRPNLLTLGRVQASLTLLSLNRSFVPQELAVEDIVTVGVVIGNGLHNNETWNPCSTQSI